MSAQCDAWTQPRPRWPGGPLSESRRCPHAARFRVSANRRPGQPPQAPWGPETPCGRHVRPYLMDNGDSVWKPWIVEAIEGPNDAS